MSTAKILSFPTAEDDAADPLVQVMADFVMLPAAAQTQAITTVVVTPTQNEAWAPPLNQRYPAAFASFARWAAAERVGDDLIVR